MFLDIEVSVEPGNKQDNQLKHNPVSLIDVWVIQNQFSTKLQYASLAYSSILCVNSITGLFVVFFTS